MLICSHRTRVQCQENTVLLAKIADKTGYVQRLRSVTEKIEWVRTEHMYDWVRAGQAVCTHGITVRVGVHMQQLAVISCVLCLQLASEMVE